MKAHFLRGPGGKILAAGVAAPDIQVKFVIRTSTKTLRATSVQADVNSLSQVHSYLHGLVLKSNADGAKSSTNQSDLKAAKVARKPRA